MLVRKFKLVLIAALCVVAISACGGGKGDAQAKGACTELKASLSSLAQAPADAPSQERANAAQALEMGMTEANDASDANRAKYEIFANSFDDLWLADHNNEPLGQATYDGKISDIDLVCRDLGVPVRG